MRSYGQILPLLRHIILDIRHDSFDLARRLGRKEVGYM